MSELEVKPHKVISVNKVKDYDEKSQEEIQKELDDRAVALEDELQTKMNADLTKMIAFYSDTTPWDAMSIISMAKLLVDSYYDLIKQRWADYNADPENFRKESAEDLKKLAETVEE
jgi:hypothetical protein